MTKLPVLVLNTHSLCNCRCEMCEIWKRKTAEEITPVQFDRMLPDIERLGVEWVVFSGGEALLDHDLFRKANELRKRGIRSTLLSSGLLLVKHAQKIAATFDDAIVSLDGPPALHDRIRGVPKAFQLLEAGISAIRGSSREYRIFARCTVQRLNCGHLVETTEAAQSLGLNSISFLAADLHSNAFGGQGGREVVALTEADLALLDWELNGLARFGTFVAESRAKLDRIRRHFHAHLGLARPESPQCNAPWVSAVVEADGSVRPCFFHSSIGHLNGEGLFEVLNGPMAKSFRNSLEIQQNPICQRCVCSLNWR